MGVSETQCSISRVAQTFDLLVPFLALTLFFDMESQILQQEDLPVFPSHHSLLDILTDTVVEEVNVFLEELRKLGCNGFERVFRIDGAVGAAEMGHENDGFGP